MRASGVGEGSPNVAASYNRRLGAGKACCSANFLVRVRLVCLAAR
jgi:hypothetical protein